MRTFVAIELNESVRRRLLQAIGTLQNGAEGVRWVREDQLHLTLKFIGELDERDLPDAIECLQEATAGVEPFTMRIEGLSGFPPRGTPRVVHIGVEEPTGALMTLHDAVEENLAEAVGVKPESRRYIPHITLGRVKKRSLCPSLDKMQDALQVDDFGEVEVDSMVLMKSDLKPTGAVYSVVHEFPLAGDGP